jgi:DNA-binding CsgD family transcriptional regulator
VDPTWPLLGRHDEIARLEDAVRGGEGIVFAGPPGVGKTRMLRAAMDIAAGDGYDVELVTATRAGASIPLGAAAHLLPASQLANPDAGFHYAACHWDDDRKLLLAVDDAHLLDERSAALVHHLCAHRHAVVVATVQSGAPTPDAVTALWHNGSLRRVELAPLPGPVVDDLIDRVLDGDVPASVRASLVRLADGRPRQLQALVLDGLEAGTLTRAYGTWQWHGAPAGTWRLRELVETGLAGCDPATRSVLELVAFGEPLPLRLLEPEPGLLTAERAGLLDVVRDGRRSLVRLRQPIHGEVLRATLPPISAREVHRTLAARHSAYPARRQEDLLRGAAWGLAAGAQPDGKTLLRAAQHALAGHDLPMAERLSRAAVEAGIDEARSFLADVLRWRGRAGEGLAVLTHDGRPAERTRWRTTKARLLYWGLARHREARRMLDVPADRSTVTHALVLVSEGRCREALDVALPIAADETELVDSRLWAFTCAVSAHAAIGQTATALALADHGLSFARDHRDGIRTGEPYLALARAYALLFAGRLAEARTAAEHGGHSALRVDNQAMMAAWAALGGTVAQLQGDLRTAVAALREAVAIGEREDPTGSLRLHTMVLAGALAMTGAGADAASALRSADRCPSLVPRHFRPQAEMNRAWVAATQGHLLDAADLALDAAALARDADLPCLEAFVLYEVARFGSAARVQRRLGELAGVTDSALVSAFASAAAALAAEDGPALTLAAATFAELAAPLLAAETMTAAANAYQATGRTTKATVALERAREFAAQCTNVQTPGLTSHTCTTRLTPREREIAALATRHTSPQIAQQLRLSVRTVNNHLAHVYDKLGITGRADLAMLFQ